MAKFDDPDPLQHPDSVSFNRYVLGTRLQSKTGHQGHKRDTCAYHNLDLAIQGGKIKSMTQESMQVVRKFRSIQQDKLRKAFINFYCYPPTHILYTLFSVFLLMVPFNFTLSLEGKLGLIS